MSHLKVINRTTRKEQIFTNEQALRFFKINNIRDYAVTQVPSPRDSEIIGIINAFAISIFSLIIVVQVSNLIFNFIK